MRNIEQQHKPAGMYSLLCVHLEAAFPDQTEIMLHGMHQAWTSLSRVDYSTWMRFIFRAPRPRWKIPISSIFSVRFARFLHPPSTPCRIEARPTKHDSVR